MVANRPSAFLRVFSVPFFMHFVRGFAAWAFRVPFIADKLRTAGHGTVPCPMLLFSRQPSAPVMLAPQRRVTAGMR